MKKEIYKDNNMENNKQEENKEDNLNQFDLDVYAGTIYGTSLPGKDKTKQETLHKKSVGGHRKKDAPSGDVNLNEDVRYVASILVNRHIDITTPYEEWIKLGFALVDGLGENGRELFHQLSRMNAEYNYEECDKKYTSCMNGNGKGVTIPTFFKMAKDVGVDLKTIQREGTVRATCANMPNAKNIDNIEKYKNSGILDKEMAHGTMAPVAQTITTGYTFSDKVNEKDLPFCLRNVYKIHPDTVSRDKMLLGILNVTSGLMGGANGSTEVQSGIYGIYDGRRVFAPLFTLMDGTAATKKGDLIFCKLLARPVKREMRQQFEASKAQYDEDMAAYEAQGKGKNKGERGPAPKEPVFRDPFMPGNSTSSAVYRALDANGGWGMMFETEADTVSNMLDSDYGHYSDFLRKVYHHETVSMTRVSDKIHIDIENPRLSVFITCTPGQIPGLFPSFENGLGSRFQFYNLPDDTVEFHDVFARSDSPLEDTYKQMGEDLLPLYHALLERKGNPIQFVMSKAQQQEFLSTYEETLCEQFQMLGAGFNAFVFRMALANFRYAMVLTALRRLSDWNKKDDIFTADERALVCDDRDFHTAMSIMGCLINHTARVYAVLAKENENPFANSWVNLNADELSVYQSLSDGEFRTADFLACAETKKICKRTAQRMLSQMSNVYRIITPLRRGFYCKAKVEEK